MEKKIEIGVIGVSKMGSAFVSVLLEANYTLNIWNRDSRKSEQFNNKLLCIRENAASVIDSSNVIFIIVDKFSSVEALLANIENLSDKVIVNCTTFTPLSALKLQELIQSKNGKFINTVIGNFPRQIGTFEANIKCAGDEKAWELYSHVIKELSPNSELLSDKPEYVNVLDAISVGIFQTAIVSFFEAVQLAEKYGINATELHSTISRIWPVINDQLDSYSIEHTQNKYFDSEAMLSTHTAATYIFIESYQQVGLSPKILMTVNSIMQSMVDNHKANFSISGIFK